MELRVLRYFATSAREGSMTKAAEKLHVTQPTLSKQIKELEEELGQKLFIRGNYNIHLTPEGEILYKRALDILEMADQTTAEFASMNQFNGGDLYLGCAESDGISLLAKTAGQLLKNMPIFIFIYTVEMLKPYANAWIKVCLTLRLSFKILMGQVLVSGASCERYLGLAYAKRQPSCIETIHSTEDLLGLPLIVSRQGATNEMPQWLQKKLFSSKYCCHL